MQAMLHKELNTDDRLRVTGVATHDLVTGAVVYLDDTASVTATVVDRGTQLAVDGGTETTWPLALTYIPASQGDYHAPLRESLVVTAHQALEIVLVIDNGPDQKRTLVLPCVVVIDRG